MTSDRIAPLLILIFSLAACHSHADGTSVSLVASASPVDVLVDGSGGVLEVERFELRLDTFELLFCEDPVARMVRELFLPGVARALHPTGGTPTVLAGPLTIDVSGGDAVVLGELHPPAGRYCGAMLVFGAASLRGTYEEAPLERELALGATLFVEFEALELSAASLDGEILVHLDATDAFAVEGLSLVDEALADALEESLPALVDVTTMSEAGVY